MAQFYNFADGHVPGSDVATAAFRYSFAFVSPTSDAPNPRLALGRSRDPQSPVTRRCHPSGEDRICTGRLAAVPDKRRPPCADRAS